MLMRPVILWVALCGLLMIAPVAMAQDSPTFEAADCPFDRAEFAEYASADYDLACGYITVPESRNPDLADDTNAIRLLVTVVSSFSATPEPDPVMYLEGGPGSSVILDLSYFAYMVDSFAPLLETRDLIFFEQRGVGPSEADLSCPELLEFAYDVLDDDIPTADLFAQYNEILLGCRARHIEAGANLGAYTTGENAADVADIIASLGYEQANIYGISYGTRLALEVMRNHPDVVRSSVIDAVYPPQINAYAEELPNADRAFTTLFEGCAADPLCNEQFPDLETVFYATVDRLNETPELVTFYDYYTEVDREVLVTGEFLIDSLFSLLYPTWQLPDLPRAIYEAQAGRYDLFLDDLFYALAYITPTFNDPTYWSVECNDEVAFSTYDEAVKAGADTPAALREYWLIGIESYFDLCAAWLDGAADPSYKEPVVSDIPTLVTVGEYDPITPPAWAADTAQHLSNSYYFEFPGFGHSVSGYPCPDSIIQAFILDPASKPDASCIADLTGPQFVPVPVTDVTLIPFTDKASGFSSVTPEGWALDEDLDPTYGGTGYILDAEVGAPLIAFRFPPDLQAYIDDLILPGWSYDQLPEPLTVLETDQHTWTLYSLNDQDNVYLYGVFAFEENAGVAIGIIANSPSERAFMTDNVLYPALEAFELIE
jgi:pimeloyl-ACP methyl ester carboxylesterase